jgi:phage N-6-adenine-methyltransferase
MNTSLHFSSDEDTWETPQDFYDRLHKEFSFTLDVCATNKTAKCARFFTPVEDGLAQDWTLETCWMNPPYGRGIKHRVEKAYQESLYNGATVVCFIPSRTDTVYWHDFVMHAAEIRFLRGRVRFSLDGKEINAAPFPSAIVVFRSFESSTCPQISSLSVSSSTVEDEMEISDRREKKIAALLRARAKRKRAQ